MFNMLAVVARQGATEDFRFKGSIVDASEYLLACYRYIELNPVRAGIVGAPEEYPWSSYRANAQGVADPVVCPHDMYQGLGRDEEARQAAYRALFRGYSDERDIGEIRACLQSGTPLGNDRFREEVERMLKVKVGHTKRGRPKQNSSRLNGL